MLPNFKAHRKAPVTKALWTNPKTGTETEETEQEHRNKPHT